MSHPNDDFIKKFLGEQKPVVDRRQQRLQEYYDSLKNPKTTLDETTKKHLVETATRIFRAKTTSSDSVPFIHPSEHARDAVREERTRQQIEKEKRARKQRLEEYYTSKKSNLEKQNVSPILEILEKSKKQQLLETKQVGWLEKKTPFGIFYFHPEQQMWMNSFGVMKRDFSEFFDVTDMEATDNSRPIVVTPVIESFFSDSGNYLAMYTSETSEVNIFGVTYSPSVALTLQDTVNVGNIPLSTDTERSIFVSDDGAYLVASCPANKSVYFFDVAQNSLLQTITEDYPSFGNKIAVDKDFYGMAISTPELTRTVNAYDGRITSYAISSPVCYYRRNFGSTGAQQFKKIHTHNATTNSRSNGLASWDGVSKKINLSTYYNNPPTGSLYNTCGVNRCDDIVVKGYNFALSTIALEEDQITYRAQFPNLSNPRFDVVKDPGFTFAPNYTDNMAYKMFGATGSITFPASIVTVPLQTYTDEFLANTTASNYFMEGTFGLKNFSIIRKINNVLVPDGSYLDPATIAMTYAPELWSIITEGGSNVNTAYNFNFMSKMYIKQASPFSDNSIPRPSHPSFGGNWDDIERRNYIREEAVNAKTALNNSHVYTISKYITNSSSVGSGVTAATQNLNIPNIRIYRFPATNTAGTDSYLYNDWGYTGATYTQEPSSDPYGWLKVMYDATDASNLESAFVRSGSFNTWAPPEVPVLADPTDCPDSEFAYPVNRSLLEQDVLSAYVSDDRLFVNFVSATMVFEINNLETYKPLLFEAALNESLDSYSFTYNASGEFFTKENIIYKYNRTTHQLDSVTTIG